MNQIEIEVIKKINRLAKLALLGNIENFTAVKEIEKISSELIEFKDFDNMKW